ncbi:MAG: hypothetical protein AB4911_24345, partial [Oscillochloridaceae bacterium umkhey_bin13]
MQIEEQNQAIREALDRFDFARAQELLAEAKPYANAETWYLAALAEKPGSQKALYLRLALERDPNHAAAKQAQAYAVEANQPVAQAHTPSVPSQAVVATKQQIATSPASVVETKQVGAGPSTATNATDASLPPSARITNTSTNPNAFTVNGTKYLYRPTRPFIIIAMVAALVGVVANFAELGRQVNDISQSSVFIAYLIAAVCAGLAAGALARARVGVLILLAAPFPTMFIFAMIYSFFGSDFSNPRFSLSVGAGLMSAVAVAFVLSQQSEPLVGGNSLVEPKPVLRKAVFTSALVGGGVMLPLIAITPEYQRSSGLFDFSLTIPPAFIVPLVAFGYGLLGIFASAVMRDPHGRKPTSSFWVLLFGSTIGVGMLPPALWIAVLLGRQGQPPVPNSLMLFAIFDPPVVIGSGMLAFAATFLCIGIIYLATSWQNAYPPPPPTPEQAQQTKQALGALGLFALFLGAAYLKHSADQAQQQEALRQQRLRQQEALRQQQYAAQQRQQQAQQYQQSVAPPRPPAPSTPPPQVARPPPPPRPGETANPTQPDENTRRPRVAA